MIVDCSVHPVLDEKRFRTEIGPPWNLARLPGLFGDRYRAPFDQLRAPVEQLGDPVGVAAYLFDEQGISLAVLSPSTRGYYPNPQQAAAVASAANTVLCEDWLESPASGGRFLGSIRVAVNDPALAVREIERWAADDRFVQIVVPLRVFEPYGDERFFPIWRAACEHNLPIYVHDDPGTLVESTPTPVGFPRYFAEYHALRPMTGLVHLASLITMGVFGRLPDLRFVFGDVSVHLARALLLRTDKDWRSGRAEIPWVTELPSEAMLDHVRFVRQPEDTAAELELAGTQLADENTRLVLYGSRYPYWDDVDKSSTFAAWPAEARERGLAANAMAFYPKLAAQSTIA